MGNSIPSILIDVISGAATLYMFVIMVRALMTWIRQDLIMRFYKVFEFTAGLTDPFLDFIRRFFPSTVGRVDLSPVIALIIIEVVKYALIMLVRMLYKI